MDIPLRPLASKPSQPGTRLRDLFSLGATDKKLRRALSLLEVHDLDSFENHFLALEAFLKPWSHFRDTFLLVRPQNATTPPTQTQTQRQNFPTADVATEPEAVIHRSDILWFYTHFLHGELRYDARADETSGRFTYDETQYGKFDKR